MDIRADLHTHTRYSHGSGTIQENVDAAVKKGLLTIGISDHGPANIGIGVKLEDFEKMRDEIEKLKSVYTKIDILLGCEANVISIDGKLDIPQYILDKLDYVMAGLHPIVVPASLYDGLNLFLGNLIGKHVAVEKVMKNNTTALINAINNYNIDIITHPGLHLPINTALLAQTAAKKGTALEINAGHGSMTIEYVKIAKSCGAKFAIGSDAHCPEKVGELENGIDIAKKSGLVEKDIINTYISSKTPVNVN